MSVTVHHGDCLDVLRGMDEASVDSVVTDPPYHLTSIVKRFGGENAAPAKSDGATGVYGRASAGFMGKQWDGGDVAFRPETWAEVLRVMKPGAHLVAFGSTRGYHRMVCAIDDAGFEIRDQLAWLYSQGFPKSHNLPGGWGTALKPAHEPIALARKPLACPTVAAQVLATGTGALNIDGCRVPTDENLNGGTYLGATREADEQRCLEGGKLRNGIGEYRQPAGRWPANLVHDGSPEVLAAFAKFGERHAYGPYRASEAKGRKVNTYGEWDGRGQGPVYADTGTAARFFPALGFGDAELRFHYGAKASKAERAGSKHPTVKPLALMRWLCRLVTPPGGTVLDCFAGTGVTGEAALLEGFGAVLVEREAEHVADIRRRLGRARGDDAPLFAESAA